MQNTGILEDEKKKEIKNVNQHTFHVKMKERKKQISSQEPESKIIKRYNVYALDLILKIEIYITYIIIYITHIYKLSNYTAI